MKLTPSIKEAIAKHFNIETDLVGDTGGGYEQNLLKIDGVEYAIYNDNDADKAVYEAIENEVWTFNSNFLAAQTKFPEKIFIALEESYEDGNDAILALIEKSCGLEDFVAAAVESDGRGHFLAYYDSEEIEIYSEGDYYYLYRLN